jgi:hypothetical protein
MIPFVVVKTKAGSAHIRPDRVVAVNATDAEECMILMTDGVTIAAKEPAADVVARLESAARSADETAKS